MSQIEGPEEGAVEPRPASRRHVTILFTDLSGSKGLAAGLEGEDYADLMDALRQAFAEAVEGHGGTVNQIRGDGLQAVFGYPAATENDAVYAVEAALDMHEAVRTLRSQRRWRTLLGLSVHSGIHAGRLLIRPGDNVAGIVELFGPAPAVASFLSDSAGPDELLVSEESLGPVSPFFRSGGSRELKLEGQTLSAHLITGRSGVRRRYDAHVTRGLVPFIGREELLSQLHRRLETARSGRPAMLALSAPPGTGKTRLAEELLRQAAEAGWAVLRGHCEEGPGAQPLQPFLQMLQQACRRQPAEGAGPAAEPTGEWLAAWRSWLAGRAQAQAQLLFVDDWQWADQPSRQLAHAMCQWQGLPLLVLVTTRPLDRADAALAGADLLNVPPFNDDEARRAAERLLPRADPFVVESIIQQCGGNPLYLEELCHAAARNAHSMSTGPAWLETLIESRVAALAPGQVDLLAACAVIGNPVPAWQLEALCGCAATDPGVTALARQDLLFPAHQDGLLRFKHGITRDVVYRNVGRDRRRDMHRRIAELIHSRVAGEGEEQACEALARHHAGAEDFPAAARFAQMAGDKALAASSLSLARTHYLNALEQLDRLDSHDSYKAWRATVRRLGFVCVFDPMRADLPIFERAVTLARKESDAAGLAYGHYWRAYVLYALGDLRAAVRGFAQAREAARPVGDPALDAQLRSTLGQALCAAADYEGALGLLEGASQPVPTRGSSATALAFSWACRASALGDMGHFEDSLGAFSQALAALPREGHEVQGSVLCWRSGVLLWQGHWEDARRDAEVANHIGANVKSLYLFAMSQALGAFARWRIDGSVQALRDLADAAGWLESRDKHLFISLVHGWLAETAAATGHPAQAYGSACKALLRRRQGDWLGAAMAARALARLAAEQGDWRAAFRHLARAERAAMVRRSGHEAACNALCRVQLQALRGDDSASRAAAEACRQEFQRLGMGWHVQQAEAWIAAPPRPAPALNGAQS